MLYGVLLVLDIIWSLLYKICKDPYILQTNGIFISLSFSHHEHHVTKDALIILIQSWLYLARNYIVCVVTFGSSQFHFVDSGICREWLSDVA